MLIQRKPEAQTSGSLNIVLQLLNFQTMNYEIVYRKVDRICADFIECTELVYVNGRYRWEFAIYEKRRKTKTQK